MNTAAKDILLIFLPFIAGFLCFIFGVLSVYIIVNIFGFIYPAAFLLYPISFVVAITASFLVHELGMLIVKRYFKINRKDG